MEQNDPIPKWTMEAYPATIAVVSEVSPGGYMVIRKTDLRPDHELFGPDGKGYPPDHIPPPAEKADRGTALKLVNDGAAKRDRHHTSKESPT